MPAKPDLANAHTLAAVAALLSPRMGLLASVAERRAPAGGAPSIDVAARLAINASGVVDLTYGGGSTSGSAARAAAIGESLERYALGRYDPAALTTATFSEAAQCGGTPLESLSWFLPEQYEAKSFPLRPPAAADVATWAVSESLATGEASLVPASLVFMPYRYRSGEPALSYQTSVGTSCHRTSAAAKLGALLEVVERDALTICWESGVSYPRVPAAQVLAVDRRLPSHSRLSCFNITSDLEVPAVVAIIVTSSPPVVGIGSAAHVMAERALERSIEEAATSWNTSVILYSRNRQSAADLARSMAERTSLSDHALFYAFAEHLPYLDFLLEGRQSERPLADLHSDLRSPDSSLASLRQCLGSRGYDAHFVDITPPETSALGFHVARAVAPQLARPSIGTTVRHLGCPRIADVPFRLGYTAAPIDPHALVARFRPSP